MNIAHLRPDDFPGLLKGWECAYGESPPPAILEAVARLDACYVQWGAQIYVCGEDEAPQVLVEHPEIRWAVSLGAPFGSVGSLVDEPSDEMVECANALKAASLNDLNLALIPMTDWDQRAAGPPAAGPSEAKVTRLLNFLRKWAEAGNGAPPSLLVHCAHGMYRSAAAALIAHTLVTNDPVASGVALVTASRGGLMDANWEIARYADEALGLNGTLHQTAVNVGEAVRRRLAMHHEGRAADEISRAVEIILRQPITVAPERVKCRPQVERAYVPDEY